MAERPRGRTRPSVDEAFRRSQLRTRQERAAIETGEKEELSIVKIRVVKAFALVGSITFFVALFILLWHYFGPESTHWLTPLQLSKIESVFGGSGAAYLVISLSRRYIWT